MTTPARSLPGSSFWRYLQRPCVVSCTVTLFILANPGAILALSPAVPNPRFCSKAARLESLSWHRKAHHALCEYLHQQVPQLLFILLVNKALDEGPAGFLLIKCQPV